MPSTPLPDLLRILLVVVACVAGITDARSRKIPNWLVLAGLIGGFGSRFYLQGGHGLLSALEGMLLAFVIYFPLWLLRGMGAGDVKLMAALGALVGPAYWFSLFVLSSLLGAVFALILLLSKGQLRKTLWNVGYVISELIRFRAPYLAKPDLDVNSKSAITLPHGVTIACGALLSVLLSR